MRVRLFPVLSLACVAAAGLGLSTGVTAQELLVGPGGFAEIADAVASSAAGDTLRITSGSYRGPVVVTHPLVLLGEDGAVLEGRDEGVVLRVVDAPGTEIRGLTIRGSGQNIRREDAGVMIERSPGSVVADCTVEDVLFGVYAKDSRGSTVERNVIEGKDLEIASRGDGVRLWYSPGGRVQDNTIRRTRDLVVFFSDSVTVRGNQVTGGRYGLHYMYSDEGRFVDNVFSGNLVGAFLMYSAGLTLSGNVFAGSRGATGMGLGLKDTDRVAATENVIVANATGIHLDNSPQQLGSENLFRDNDIALNRVGVSLLPSVRGNGFEGNRFIENVRDAAVPGRGDALGNSWDGNAWGSYAGFDRNRDGIGDTPHVAARLSDRLLTTYPELELFAFSPAAAVLDVLAKVLPFLEPTPILVDAAPVMRPSSSRSREQASAYRGRLAVGVLLLVSGSLAVFLFARLRTFEPGVSRSR